MSSAEPWLEGEAEAVWYRVDLDQVAELVDGYELWKDTSWYHRVTWHRVASVVDDVLQRNCLYGLVDDLFRLLRPGERNLKKADREGLASLVCEPVQIRRTELTNGGHRAVAMRRQGVRFVPGLCVRADVGFSVDPSQVYPVKAAG